MGKEEETRQSPEPHRLSPELHRSSRRRERSNSSGENEREGRHRSRSRRDRHSRDRRGRSESEDNHSPERLHPSRTIVIRGLSRDVIKKEEIMRELDYYCASPKDIRIIRRKTTGSSRGFAFVEFNTVREATRWMEKSKGVFIQADGRRAVLEYSRERDPCTDGRRHRDWICKRCGCNNFRARVVCFKCQAPIEESERNGSGLFRVSTHPTKTILLQGLDVLSTEDSVLQAIQTLSSHAIRSIRLERDKLTNISLGICYIEMHTVSDAMELFRIMMENCLIIDGKEASVEFCNPLQQMPEKKKSEVASIALAAAQWSHQSASTSTAYTPTEIESLAQYSASLYAKTEEEQQAYLEYYRQYYTNQGSAQSQTVSKPPVAPQNGIVSALPVQAATTVPAHPECVPQQNSNSDYAYVESLGLYYSYSTGYYYNPQSQQFLYWDATKQSYESISTMESGSSSTDKDGGGAKKKEPQEMDKQKVAKKITKDMERWAKSLKQKKEPSRVSVPTVEVQQPARESKSADAGYAVLERRVYQIRPEEIMQIPDIPESAASSLVAAYGGDSDSDGDAEKQDSLVDWNKLACLLCRRQFPSKAVLVKHQEQSALHLNNLEALKKSGKKETQRLQSSNLRGSVS